MGLPAFIHSRLASHCSLCRDAAREAHAEQLEAGEAALAALQASHEEAIGQLGAAEQRLAMLEASGALWEQEQGSLEEERDRLQAELDSLLCRWVLEWAAGKGAGWCKFRGGGSDKRWLIGPVTPRRLWKVGHSVQLTELGLLSVPSFPGVAAISWAIEQQGQN